MSGVYSLVGDLQCCGNCAVFGTEICLKNSDDARKSCDGWLFDLFTHEERVNLDKTTC